jgi:hypothetical protein
MLQFSNSRPAVFGAQLERDELWFDRHPALAFCLSMIFSENRFPPVGSKPRGQAFPDHASRAKLAIDLENVCEPRKPPRRRARQLLHWVMSDYQL